MVGESMRKLLSVLLMIPFISLLFLFLIDAKGIEYVWLNGGADLPILYRISAIWSGREGPLLLWISMLGGLIWFDGEQHPNESKKQHIFRLRILVGFSLVLLMIAMWLNPFSPTPIDANDNTRPGLNALLQTDLMVIHPPVVFAFYTLCIGVGAHALSAMLISGQTARERILKLARPALWVGTLGVGLGGLWAYTVLDWGGYWAWDPVETGSMLPWLALVILLHLRLPKGMNREDDWFIGVGILPAFFAIHATLVTRANGVWASVHAFVAEGEVDTSMGPIQRILSLGFEDPAGLEVHVYLAILFVLLWAGIRHFAKKNIQQWSPIVILVGAIIGNYLDAVEIGILASTFAFLYWNQNHSPERFVWMSAGILLMLFGFWSFLLSLQVTVIGMALFLLPWLIESEDATAQEEMTSGIIAIHESAVQQKIVLWVPLAIGSPFLLLTWLLLLAEVDGTNLAWHEIFGMPLLCLTALGLTVYSWKNIVSPNRIPTIIAALVVFSLLFAWKFGELLPGDADHEFLGTEITRGMIAGFAIPILVFSLPPIANLVFTRMKQFNAIRKPLHLRRFAIHLAHLGILLLLLGHAFTTTLVQRGDPSHIVMLTRDTPIEHGGYWYTFTELTAIGPDDSEWDEEVGDGKITVVIQVSLEEDGDAVATLSPGMLRFDEGGIPARSEIDIWHRPQGDVVMIFDQSQANQLYLTSFMQTGESVDNVRVVIYDLTGSHLVWTGWSLILIGTALSWIMYKPRRNREEE